jgi:hypothetical protein
MRSRTIFPKVDSNDTGSMDCRHYWPACHPEPALFRAIAASKFVNRGGWDTSEAAECAGCSGASSCEHGPQRGANSWTGFMGSAHVRANVDATKMEPQMELQKGNRKENISAAPAQSVY